MGQCAHMEVDISPIVPFIKEGPIPNIISIKIQSNNYNHNLCSFNEAHIEIYSELRLGPLTDFVFSLDKI